MSHSEQFQQGAESARRKIRREDNPYPMRSNEYFEWDRGWISVNGEYDPNAFDDEELE
jgi:hypothetical protein